MQAEGTRFRTGVDVGVDITGDAAARAATTRSCSRSAPPRARDLPVPGPRARRHPPGDGVPAAGQPGVAGRGRRRTRSSPTASTSSIIGGGDTGADCLGTAHRQGAASVTQLEIMPQPGRRPARRPAVADVPDDLPGLLRARGGRRAGLRRRPPRSSSATTTATSARCGSSRSRWSTAGSSQVEGTEREIPADLVLLAMGFTGPEQAGAARAARRRARRARQHRPRRRLHDHACRASSSPATPAAGSR